jgi:hypothetical protein
MKKIIFAVFLIMISSSAFAQWIRTNGPEGVAVSSLANIGGTIYTGTEVNGVYASTNDGISWTARNTGIETLEVTSIKNKPGYILAGTFGGGVYRSTDNGQTWIAPSNSGDIAVTSMVVNDPYILVGTVGDGIQRSSDNGATWTQLVSPNFIDAMCISGIKIFASSSFYTYASTNNGNTWFEVTALTGALINSYYCEGNTIIAGGVNKIYRSTDNGNTFVTINLNFSFGIVNIYSITAVGSVLFMGTSYDGVYKSTNNGSTWFSANVGMGPKDVRAVTNTNSSTLIAGSHYVGMYRSTNLGLSWNKSLAGFPAGTSILSLLESGSSIYAGTRDGVYRTVNNGNNWAKLTGTNDTVNYSSVWAMCESGGVIYASMHLYFNATIYKSTNNGINWIRCAGAGLPSGLSFIKGLVASGDKIIAGTNKGIYYSSDSGTSWNPTNVLNLNIPSLAVSGNFVYAAVPSGLGVYRSTNNGVNWSVALVSTVDYVEVAANNNYAYAGSFFSGARYSSNYGGTWTPCNGFPPDASIFALGTVGNAMVLAGTDLSPSWIYASFDNGNSFSSYSEGLFERASVEAFTVNDTFMFAGTDYNGVWRRLRPDVLNVQTQQEVPLEYSLSQNYPNPFNPKTKIRFDLHKSSQAKLIVYSILGREIKTLVNEKLNAGSYEVSWDGSDYSSGIYFYKLVADEYVNVKKMVLLK